MWMAAFIRAWRKYSHLVLGTGAGQAAPGEALATKADLVNGKVPSSQLPAVGGGVELGNEVGKAALGEDMAAILAVFDPELALLAGGLSNGGGGEALKKLYWLADPGCWIAEGGVDRALAADKAGSLDDGNGNIFAYSGNYWDAHVYSAQECDYANGFNVPDESRCVSTNDIFNGMDGNVALAQRAMALDNNAGLIIGGNSVPVGDLFTQFGQTMFCATAARGLAIIDGNTPVAASDLFSWTEYGWQVGRAGYAAESNYAWALDPNANLSEFHCGSADSASFANNCDDAARAYTINDGSQQFYYDGSAGCFIKAGGSASYDVGSAGVAYSLDSNVDKSFWSVGYAESAGTASSASSADTANLAYDVSTDLYRYLPNVSVGNADVAGTASSLSVYADLSGFNCGSAEYADCLQTVNIDMTDRGLGYWSTGGVGVDVTRGFHSSIQQAVASTATLSDVIAALKAAGLFVDP